MKIPKLQFDFYNSSKEGDGPIIFQEPREVITTYNIDEVASCLEKIKSAINKGYYVAGFLSYEATYALYNLKQTIDSDFPLLWFGVFNDTNKQNNHIEVGNYKVGTWKMKESKKSYLANLHIILRLIADGKTRQVNYTTPLETSFSGDSYAYYERLKKAQKAHYNAFLQFDKFDIVSVSPEKFFSIENDRVTLRPMKGTIHRGLSFEEDEKLAHWLKNSKKNQLENDLIIHLMKKELEQVAHNLSVYDQYRLEQYPTLWQMTTALTAKLNNHVHPVDLLTTLFPCGSITGAPKEETIKTIAQLERQHRGIYCGSIGYFTPSGEAYFNVAIRTVTIDKLTNKAIYHAGGAITEQSLAEEEYEEVITKTSVLTKAIPSFDLIETLLIEEGKVFLEEQHRLRLKNSAHYFAFSLDEKELDGSLSNLKRTYNEGSWRARLLLSENGELLTEVYPLEATKLSKVALAKVPIDSQQTFLYHKTTERTVYENAKEGLAEDYLDVLLWNEAKEITEFTIGNLVVRKDGKLLTPPLSSGLLPGTFREHLLANNIIEECVLHVEDLKDVTDIWLINSVRKWVKVTLHRGSI